MSSGIENKPMSVAWRGGWISLLVCSLYLAGCGWRLSPKNVEALQRRYAAAVKDAASVEPKEIYRDLAPISTANHSLRWRGEPGASAVRVATWTSWDGYKESEGQEMTLSRPVWVTLVPKAQEFCRSLSRRRLDRVTLRLEQLLGLPPNDGKDRFAELWVEPADLFRPCPDPEINDQACGLEFPKSSFLDLDQAYEGWFEGNHSYGEDGYPWTRLGYTYDWGRRRRQVGISVYVIRQDAKVTVIQVSATTDYCGLDREGSRRR